MMKRTGVLMVGSVPGASADDVFTRLAAALPGRLPAIPDGETGDRWNYIGWQLQRFPREARRPELGGTQFVDSGLPSYTISDIQPTGYDEMALASYADLTRLRQQGTIPSNIPFQICLPSPYSVLAGHLKPEIAVTIEPLYEQRFAEALDNIVAKIPHHDMIIQWDLCFEMTAIEFDRGRLTETRHQAYFAEPVLTGLVNRIKRLSERIPKDVKLAFHLCYGDLKHKHFIEPEDTSRLVEMANALLAHEIIGTRTAWIHLPVPKDRTDPGYFSSISGLELNRHSRVSGAATPYLYLGLVHANDEAGTWERIETAAANIPFPFGVATECGLGRTPPEDVGSIFQICRDASTERPEESL